MAAKDLKWLEKVSELLQDFTVAYQTENCISYVHRQGLNALYAAAPHGFSTAMVRYIFIHGLVPYFTKLEFYLHDLYHVASFEPDQAFVDSVVAEHLYQLPTLVAKAVSGNIEFIFGGQPIEA